MSLDRRKWRSSSGLAISQLLPGHRDESEKKLLPEPVEGRAPRVLTRALRSLSSSSMDSTASSLLRSSSTTRRLQKSPSTSGSMIGRLHRRVSRRSNPASGSFSDPPGSPIVNLSQPFSTMDVVQYGPLKADISLLKARSEYLVLSDQCLVKFVSGEAARSAFPQLTRAQTQARDSSPHRIPLGRSAAGEIRLEIPLHAIVAVFDEDGSNDRSAIEIWWFSQWPRARLRKTPGISHIPENLKARINHIVRATEGSIDEAPQNLIFPVARRVFGLSQKASAADESHDNTDSSSFYFVIGPCMCHLIEVLKADHSTLPGDLRVKATSYGTVTLTRFKASVASHEQRFIMCFRSPFGHESRLDLASVQYRRIIEALTKADRILKPMWPQHFQQAIFDIKGLPPPLQLTSGNDLGGLKRSLQAYCAAYQVRVPEWKIEWSTPPQPAFRLLPLEGESYSSLQLLAVFRALRYNSFFKAISFRGVDLSPLTGKNDCSQYGDAVAYRSLNGLSISEDHHEVLLQAPILGQEMHALTFASESIRSIDLNNVLGLQIADRRQSRLKCDLGSLRTMSSELLRPMMMLWREQLCACHSVSLSGNPLALPDVDEFANILVLDHVHFKKLDLARFEMMQNTLRQLKRITKLNIAGNTRITSDESLFDEAIIGSWALQDIDLSGIALNDKTIDVLAAYLRTQQSHGLRVMRLNSCGLTGRQISRLFRAMGQARRVTVHLNANRLDEGIDDLCRAVACGFAPWSLFLQMVEFALETNYVKLLRALTVNKTIECLSLAGMAMADAASSTACQAIADFLSKNNKVRFLDISGYDSKLDEGRLGRGFAGALSGMKSNTRIEHLRVRSQMLNANIGDLAEAISANKTLHTLDCEGNDFNLSNMRHLIKHLEDNSTIRQFSAFSDQELSRTIRKSMHTAGTALPLRRASVISRFRHEKPQNGSGTPLVQQLKDEWDGAVADLERLLRKNREAFAESEDDDADFASHGQWRGSDAEWVAKAQRLRSDGRSPSCDVAISPSTDGASTADMPSPPELESPPDREYSLGDGLNTITVIDEARDSNYTFCEGFDVDGGLQIKRYRRYLDTTPSCIEEEEGGGAGEGAA
ncbi:leucine rich repeat protein [Hirsutella rhossiliensis]|uniref:Leucine rich repeat protein n=1 Tax=Hirsutella rhossiliensis TaxID=111463 RepID=A0A9P8MY14_9HYPO|nr:leucine rich repeat protein [Hirsutella rhossiliensis]KAH0963052.1 leucine rich repeat protein [Hirsutella rhossiliensis]